jgi:hypothetical protein
MYKSSVPNLCGVIESGWVKAIKKICAVDDTDIEFGQDGFDKGTDDRWNNY